MSDFNRNIRILVTVIEENKTDSFLVASPAIPWDFHIGEVKILLEEFIGSDIDFETLLNDYRDRRAKLHEYLEGSE